MGKRRKEREEGMGRGGAVEKGGGMRRGWDLSTLVQAGLKPRIGCGDCKFKSGPQKGNQYWGTTCGEIFARVTCKDA